MSVPPSRTPISLKIQRRLFNLEDRLFERRRGLELSTKVSHAELVSDDAACLAHATAYQAVWCQNLRLLFRAAAKTGIDLRHFVDIGSGKGKACFYAAGKRPFDTIVGIEFSPPLVAAAQANARRFGAQNIHFHCADATRHPLPGGNSLVFMFNPFDAVLFEQFVVNHLDHFRRHDSLIAYANDNHHEMLQRRGFQMVYRHPKWKMSLHRFVADQGVDVALPGRVGAAA